MVAIAVLMAVAGVIGAVLLLSLLFAWPFMVAWNYVVPAEFGLHALTWLQAWALSFVASVLFHSSSAGSKSK